MFPLLLVTIKMSIPLTVNLTNTTYLHYVFNTFSFISLFIFQSKRRTILINLYLKVNHPLEKHIKWAIFLFWSEMAYYIEQSKWALLCYKLGFILEINKLNTGIIEWIHQPLIFRQAYFGKPCMSYRSYTTLHMNAFWRNTLTYVYQYVRGHHDNHHHPESLVVLPLSKLNLQANPYSKLSHAAVIACQWQFQNWY